MPGFFFSRPDGDIGAFAFALPRPPRGQKRCTMLQSLPLLWLVTAGSPADLGPVPAGTARVYLIRHGEAFSNLDPEPDLPPEKLDSLTPSGQAQSRAVGFALRSRGVSLILSSPAGRARGTAEEIRAVLGAEMRIEPRLRPLDLGRGRDAKTLGWNQRIAEWKAGRDPVPVGGESLEQAGQRVLDLIVLLRRDHAGKSIVLVSHGEVIGSVIGALRGRPPANRYPPQVRNGSLTVVEAGPAGAPALRFDNQLPEETPPERDRP